jgi:hypothetical protein
MARETYYHGTNLEGIIGIYHKRQAGVNYFDGVGLYLTKDFDDANNHGQYVLQFRAIDESKLEQDDTNDGYFYRGEIPFNAIEMIMMEPLDGRVINDIIGLVYAK